MTPSVGLSPDSRYASVSVDDVELVRGGDTQELTDDQLGRLQQDADRLTVGGQEWAQPDSDNEDSSAEDEAARAKAEAEARAAEEKARQDAAAAQREQGGGSR